MGETVLEWETPSEAVEGGMGSQEKDGSSALSQTQTGQSDGGAFEKKFKKKNAMDASKPGVGWQVSCHLLGNIRTTILPTLPNEQGQKAAVSQAW